MKTPEKGKRRIRQTVWGNWYGYEGTRRVESFGDSPTHSAQEAAEAWRDRRDINEESFSKVEGPIRCLRPSARAPESPR